MNPTDNPSANDVQKQKTTLKLFGFIPLFSLKKRGGKTTYYLFGLPFWKVRHIENTDQTKYYFFFIPLLRLHKTSEAEPTEIIQQNLDSLTQSANQQFSSLDECLRYLSEQISGLQQQIPNTRQDVEDRIRVSHAELLERLDNLPHKS